MLEDRKPAQFNQSLANGIACLQALVQAGKPVGSRDMARLLGMEHTRVNRLLGSLAALGLAARTPKRKYQPGTGIHVLAAQSLQGSRLLACAIPSIRKLLLNSELTVTLSVIWRKNLCSLIHCLPGRPVEEGIGSLTPYPVLISSIGHVMLAAQSDEEVRKRLLAEPDPVAESELNAILAQLPKIRKSGVAFVERSPAEAFRGKVSIGVTIGKPAIAGLALTGDIPRTRYQECHRLLATAAAEITHELQSSRERTG